jgi:hypothetical protein
MHRLEELEYLIVHHGGRGQQFVYELAYAGQGKDGTPFLPQLLDISKLERGKYDENRSPLKDGLSPAGRAQVASKSPTCRPGVGPVFKNDSVKKEPINGKPSKIASREESKNATYLQHRNDAELNPTANIQPVF